ncbi:hypothetical protein [uncultured Cardiobacterium sp.]|uniref:hypothetical protein n=1 Tax=uncultured Cardiobacterium sp. TaxID=417619 RepID=UPI0026298740|nr:hypothetical protein [uncultured Cardiobacterium sp.]
MRIINTVKHLKEWQLTRQDSGKTWALLPFLNGLPRESGALLHETLTRCDTVLAVLDGDGESNRPALAMLDDEGCDTALPPTLPDEASLPYAVLDRCAQAIRAGHDVASTMRRGENILKNKGITPLHFGCYDIHTLIHSHRRETHSILWMRMTDGIYGGYAVSL